MIRRLVGGLRDRTVVSAGSSAEVPEDESGLREEAALGKPRAQERLGLLLAKRGRHEEAIALLVDAWAAERREPVYAALRRLLQDHDEFAKLEDLLRPEVERGRTKDLRLLGWAIASQKGREEEAAPYLLEALERNVSPVAAQMNLAEMAEKAGRVEEAITRYEDARRRGEDEVAPQRLARLLEDGPRDGEVAGLYAEAIEAGNTAAPRQLARYLWDRGRVDEAEQAYRKALRVSRRPAPALELACLLHTNAASPTPEMEGLVHEALVRGIWPDLILSVCRFRPVSASASVWALETTLGRASARLGTEHDARSPDFRRPLEHDLADRLQAFGRLEEAERVLRGIQAPNGETSALFGEMLIEHPGREGEAAAAFRAALSAGGADERARRGLGRLAERALDLAGAVAWYRAAGAPRYALLDARDRWRAGRHDEAIETLAGAERLGAEVVLELACLLRDARGDADHLATVRLAAALDDGVGPEAVVRVCDTAPVTAETCTWLLRQTLRYAAELGPGHPCGSDHARARLTLALADRLEGEVARAEYAKAVELGGRSPTALRGLARLALADGDVDAATMLLRRAAEQHDARAVRDLVVVLRANGREQDAIAVRQAAIDAGTSELRADAARELPAREGVTDTVVTTLAEATVAGDADAACAFGRLLADRGDVEAAERAYRRGVARGHEGCLVALAELLETRGAALEAEDLRRRASDGVRR